jgi:cytidine deaminase
METMTLIVIRPRRRSRTCSRQGEVGKVLIESESRKRDEDDNDWKIQGRVRLEKMRDRKTQFYQLLETFPNSLRDHLQSVLQNNGMLGAEHCMTVMETMGISPKDLMLKLLPVAKMFAAAPISHFPVGAVAKARVSDGCGEFALFLGANIEITGLALTQTIHAEQAAVVNAWLQGAMQIDTIAVSAVPCGLCRQFLYELETSRTLVVVAQRTEADGFTSAPLNDLLPQAFGPHDLGLEAGLISSAGHLPNLSLKTFSDDPLVREALSAAERSYAPYTHNFAGCTIQVGNKKIYAGRYVENAAFNPSLSPLHTAIIRLNLDGLAPDGKITRAILVEKPTTISQRGISELLLGSLAPDARLEYFEAEDEY